MAEDWIKKALVEVEIDETEAFRIGDRWVETTPSGKEQLYRVGALHVKPKYQHKPGDCIRLDPVKDGGACCEIVMWPEDIIAVDWMRPADG